MGKVLGKHHHEKQITTRVMSTVPITKMPLKAFSTTGISFTL